MTFAKPCVESKEAKEIIFLDFYKIIKIQWKTP
jgi:hypothetical protein